MLSRGFALHPNRSCSGMGVREIDSAITDCRLGFDDTVETTLVLQMLKIMSRQHVLERPWFAPTARGDNQAHKLGEQSGRDTYGKHRDVLPGRQRAVTCTSDVVRIIKESVTVSSN
jgi:hypothetical protein